MKFLFGYRLIFDVHGCSDCAKKKMERECAIIESKCEV